MGLFKRKSREMADAARDAMPGMEPKDQSGAGIAGYNSTRYNPKVKHPQNRFNFRRPDGKPNTQAGDERRRRGFFA